MFRPEYPGYDVDLEPVLKAAADFGCLMELSCQPGRLDLDDVALMAAKERGVGIVISTDAHAVEELASWSLASTRRGVPGWGPGT